ncbi:MAG: glycoside hydrolase/phage tail family protein [Ancalomicrobiaceae bacterium]|nr:glycoside hydrolase/phage tail family protein [Ancalomicrobiaceae bacterium]
MATLVLGVAGSWLAGSIGLTGWAASAVATAGAIAGSIVDSAIIAALTPRKSAPSASTLYITNAAENAGLPKVWGRKRIAGQVIWATQFNTYTTRESSGGKGGLTGGSSTTSTHYTLSWAVAFCEGGDGTSIGRIWADGNLLDLSKHVVRFYDGSETQLPDSLIESVEGIGNVPAYRGIAYLVFDTLTLDDFGGRMPQISAEIIRRPIVTDANDLSNALRSVCLLPGAGEFVLGTTVVQANDGYGNWSPENSHTQNAERADILISLDQLAGGDMSVVPAGTTVTHDPGTYGSDFISAAGAISNPSAVSVVVSWFGTDLRAGSCQILPGVTTQTKSTTPYSWSVAGYNRSSAHLVSQVDPSTLDPTGLGGSVSSSGSTVAALGGTPSDQSVTEAIAELKRRGLRVVFYPFVMMDIPPGNALPNPYSANAATTGQSAFPWRGRITCSPAPGYTGTVDKTSAASTQIAAFFASYNAMVTHYASLCAAAGGVDAFIIASEMVGLTSVRASAGDGDYPAVDALKTLAATVKGILGSSCKVGYAADWSEYHSHRPTDGTGDVIFNMDPLWSDSHIDFIGIDNYLPISDWRDGAPNIDFNDTTGPRSIYDKAYLQANIEGGEYFAWYYASSADRAAQTRTPITDGAYSEPWIWRQKDIRSWWATAHHSRPAGVRNAAATGFSPAAKPIWFTEFGCPAVDKGTNQPNVFYDPKSAESSLPYFSGGSKDDAIQRAYLEAMLTYWRDNAPTVSGIKMVDPVNMFAWAWDARPYPDFPGRASVWRDGANYELGHWLTGRAEQVPIKWIVAELCGAASLIDYDTSQLVGVGTLCPGYSTDGVMSPRDMVAGLQDVFMFDAWESGGKIQFASRAFVRTVAIDADSLVLETESDVGYQLTRAQETDLPGALKLAFVDPYRNYSLGEVEYRKTVGNSQNVSTLTSAAVLDQTYAAGIAQSLLQQVWAARETGQLKLPPSLLAVDPGDCLTITLANVARTYRAKTATTGVFRTIEIQGFDPSLLSVGLAPQGRSAIAAAVTLGAPIIEFMDLPVFTGTETSPWSPLVAAYASPWSGVDIYRGTDGSFDYLQSVSAPAVMGELVADFYSGPRSRWDIVNDIYVQFYSSAGLISRSDLAVLNGSNGLAIKNPTSGQWEILQFANAELLATNKYKLSRLLRAQNGTEAGMGSPVPSGSRVVFLSGSSLVPLSMSIDQRGLPQTLRYGPAGYSQTNGAYSQATQTFSGIGLRPFSVSDVKGVRALPATMACISRRSSCSVHLGRFTLAQSTVTSGRVPLPHSPRSMTTMRSSAGSPKCGRAYTRASPSTSRRRGSSSAAGRIGTRTSSPYRRRGLLAASARILIRTQARSRLRARGSPICRRRL